MGEFIKIAAALRMVDACGGTYTQAETESRFGEGYSAALDEVEKALLKAAGEDAPEASPLDGKFEPEAKTGCASPEHAALTSIAVSLKRIADTLDGTAAGVCVTETIFGGNRS